MKNSSIHRNPIRHFKEFHKMLQVILLFSYIISVIGQDCQPVDFGRGSIVCQCNSSYCDYYPDPEPPPNGVFISYVSSKSGKRLMKSTGEILKGQTNGYIVKINDEEQYQVMEGFGAAFTDSAGLNVEKLSPESQKHLIRSYFGKDGNNYNLGRVPIGGSDFSTRGYTYDDTSNDTTLRYFSLTTEDFQYKIPFMKMALEINPSLRFLCASWTAPIWMKNRQTYKGYSYLLEKYYQVYADYIVKFLEEYKKHGLEFWLVSPGNEPFTSLLGFVPINSMFWSANTVSKWIIENLGPAIEKSTSNSTQILLVDDQRFLLPWYVSSIKKNNGEALKYVKAIGVHWYVDSWFPAKVLDATHNLFPDILILMTEACVGERPWDYPKVALGSWSRAERLISKLYENINHWSAGWVDWNLALDTKGGPNWVGNNVDASIIIEPEKDIFYKQPLFYVLAHFSKFVPRSSVRIQSISENNSILNIAFKTEDSQIVVILYNTNNSNKNISIVDEKIGNINLELSRKSLYTILYKNIIQI